MPATVDLGVSGIEVHTGDHICAFYRGAERDQVLIPYLQAGPRSGDECICVVDAVEPALLLTAQPVVTCESSRSLGRIWPRPEAGGAKVGAAALKARLVKPGPAA
jgi:hypothetical protein